MKDAILVWFTTAIKRLFKVVQAQTTLLIEKSAGITVAGNLVTDMGSIGVGSRVLGGAYASPGTLFILLFLSRQPCYAQPIQAKLIPDCKDSFLHCFTWTSRLHLFSIN